MLILINRQYARRALQDIISSASIYNISIDRTGIPSEQMDTVSTGHGPFNNRTSDWGGGRGIDPRADGKTTAQSDIQC